MISDIGYTNPNLGFDANCQILNLLHSQEAALMENQGAGDQADVRLRLRPDAPIDAAPITVAHELLRPGRAAQNGTIANILPDT